MKTMVPNNISDHEMVPLNFTTPAFVTCGTHMCHEGYVDAQSLNVLELMDKLEQDMAILLNTMPVFFPSCAKKCWMPLVRSVGC